MVETRVEEFRIVVEASESSRDPRRVVVDWRESNTEGLVDVDDLRDRTLAVMVGLLRSNRLIQIDELKLLGELLFVTLFGAGPKDRGPAGLLMRAIKAGQAAEDTTRRLLRVSLEIRGRAERLASLPWEYLYIPEDPLDPDTGFFLGERTNFMFTRHLPLAVDHRAIGSRPPLRILFVVLSPTAPATTEEKALPPIEYGAVLETLIGLRNSDGYTKIGLRVLTEQEADDGTKLSDEELGLNVRTTFGSFTNSVVEFDPHIVHIIGHGRFRAGEVSSGGELAFPKSDSTANWVSDQDLASTLRDSPSLRLVFLQACESAETRSSPYQVISGLAQWLAQKNIPAVIAMHFKVKSALANDFARSFYETAVSRDAIEVAMHSARRKLYTDGVMGDAQRGEFGLPVLYLRGSGALLMPLEVPAASIQGLPESRVADASRPPAREVDGGTDDRLVRLSDSKERGDESVRRSPSGSSLDRHSE